MTFFDYLIEPLIGALIGFLTNYIAVKMLFRPYNPIKLGKYTLPFTPGIVPKRKEKLAEAVGNAVGNRLFTGEDLKELLLSEETKNKIVNSALNSLNLTPAFIPVDEPEQSVNSLALTYIEGEKWELVKMRFVKLLTDRLIAASGDIDIGEIIASQMIPAISEKKGGVLSFLLNEHTVSGFLPAFKEKINAYIQENGEELIGNALRKQLDEYANRPLRELLSFEDEDHIKNIIQKAYEKLVSGVGEKFSDFVDVSSVVRSKVEQMDSRELEKLCMYVMKRELSAVINLGGIIGFILGAINLLL